MNYRIFVRFFLLTSCLACVLCRNIVFFHSNVPSNLYVNAAHGPTHIVDDPRGGTKIIRLLLYPTDKKSRAPKRATAVLTSGSANGTLTFMQVHPPIGSTVVTGIITGLTPGRHQINIHALGDLKQGCNGVGDVYNPYTLTVDWQPFNRFLGELGYIDADEYGTAKVKIVDPFVSLVGPRAVIGRAVAITELQEPIENILQDVPLDSTTTCGVIGFAA